MCCAGSCGVRCDMRICWAQRPGDVPAGARRWSREMGQAYPELGRAQAMIEETLGRKKPGSARRWIAGLQLLG